MLNVEAKSWSASAAHLLSGQQEVLVDVGSQKACIAVTFHQLEYVLLQDKEGHISARQSVSDKGESVVKKRKENKERPDYGNAMHARGDANREY